MSKLKADKRNTEREQPAGRPRVKWTGVAQLGVSALILAILTISILSAVPGSVIKDSASPVLVPIARLAGLDQGWGMFAPNPPKANSQLEVHVIMSDGTDRVWQPFDDPALRVMQWRKFKEEIVKSEEFRPGLALWAVRQMTKNNGSDARAVRVVMVAHLESIPLPGQGESQTAQKVLLDQTVPAQYSGAKTIPTQPSGAKK